MLLEGNLKVIPIDLDVYLYTLIYAYAWIISKIMIKRLFINGYAYTKNL